MTLSTVTTRLSLELSWGDDKQRPELFDYITTWAHANFFHYSGKGAPVGREK